MLFAMASSQENVPSSGRHDAADARLGRRGLSAEAVSAMTDEGQFLVNLYMEQILIEMQHFVNASFTKT